MTTTSLQKYIPHTKEAEKALHVRVAPFIHDVEAHFIDMGHEPLTDVQLWLLKRSVMEALCYYEDVVLLRQTVEIKQRVLPLKHKGDYIEPYFMLNGNDPYPGIYEGKYGGKKLKKKRYNITIEGKPYRIQLKSDGLGTVSPL